MTAATRFFLTLSAICCVPWLAAGRAASAADGPQAAGPAWSHVDYALTAEGELFAAARREAAPLTRPISLAARFAFDERPAEAAGPRGVARRYRVAEATITADGEDHRRVLASDAASPLIAVEGTMPKPFLEEGFLSREEAELLDIPFDPVLLDLLQPAGDVPEGEAWTIAADLVAGLLAIDTVETGRLTASVESVADGVVTIRLQGTISGAVDGVATRIAVDGSCEAEAVAGETAGSWRLATGISRLEVSLDERRQAGWVAPGLDIQATIEVSRSDDGTPVVEAGGLAPAAADRPAGPGRPGYVWHRHPHGRYSMAVDSRWRVVEDGPDGLVMRLIDRGMLVAQCSVLPLPRGDADAPPTVETVAGDVERSLGGQFGRIAEAEALSRSDGTRIVRVVADGTAENRPFRWIHHVLTDPGGYRAAVTFMAEPAVLERFAMADRELVAGLVLLPDPPRAAVRPAARPR